MAEAMGLTSNPLHLKPLFFYNIASRAMLVWATGPRWLAEVRQVNLCPAFRMTPIAPTAVML